MGARRDSLCGLRTVEHGLHLFLAIDLSGAEQGERKGHWGNSGWNRAMRPWVLQRAYLQSLVHDRYLLTVSLFLEVSLCDSPCVVWNGLGY